MKGHLKFDSGHGLVTGTQMKDSVTMADFATPIQGFGELPFCCFRSMRRT